MVIKNRLFPYPVLCGDTDDYLETVEFAIEPNIEDKVHEIIFNYNFEVNCDSIEKLIREGSAEYVLHLECSTTAFRTALKSDVPNVSYRLQKSLVNGEVNLVAMIVAKKDITNYVSKDLNEDYVGESFQLKKGQILAYQNLPPVYVIKKTEELANNESFFTVIKQVSLDPDEIKPLSFNILSDKIQIFVDQRTYDSFINYQGTKSVAMAMLVMPALTYMISEASCNPDNYMRYEWFQRMTKYYHSLGKDFVSDILCADENPVILAQEMLQNPISLAYRDLTVIGG